MITVLVIIYLVFGLVLAVVCCGALNNACDFVSDEAIERYENSPVYKRVLIFFIILFGYPILLLKALFKKLFITPEWY